jgi:hypothetical protein
MAYPPLYDPHCGPFGRGSAGMLGQMDRQKKLWNRPAAIMKGGEAHTVTLTDAALAVWDIAAKLRTNEPGDRQT